MSKMIGRYVVVRTFSAGVHIGVLAEKNGKKVSLTDARRVWCWYGANTLHEMSLHGVNEKSMISEPVELVELTEAIEVISCTKKAEENLRAAKWAKQ